VKSLISRVLFAAAVSLAAVVATPHEAQACGGTFCDTGPQTMPVDQKGENILYVVDSAAQTVEAHIQIQYQGEASRFAWVLPIQSTPVLSVGSEPLFTALLQGSVPSYGYSTQRDSCGDSSNGAPSAGGVLGGSGGSSSGAAGGSGQPTVLYKAQVGAFEAVVLQGGTSTEVMKWLGDNGYQQTPAAEPILKGYLEKKYLFAAIKLTGGVGVDEIHPLVVKYHGTQPCVPLKLTAVAAVENMGVRTFFLDKGRWMPTNFKHIEINPVRLDWMGFGENYLEAVTRAVDSDVAMGRAFVTEYAGSSAVVPTSGLFSSFWNAEPFKDYKPVFVVQELEKQGLMQCGVFVQGGPSGSFMGCVYNHPLLKSILTEFLPAPKSVPEDEFYDNLDQYESEIDQLKWDGVEFAKRLQERIIDPGKHASDLLEKNPYLSRLFTTISPAEMTVDPEFHPRHDLPEVAAARQGNRRILCNNQAGIRLPDTRDVALSEQNQWPAWTDEMPWAETISDIPLEGAPIDLKVNTPKINELLAAWNKSRNWPPPPLDGSGGAGGVGASAGGAGGGGGAGGSAAADPEGGCSSAPGGSSPGWLFLVVSAALLRLRRKLARGRRVSTRRPAPARTPQVPGTLKSWSRRYTSPICTVVSSGSRSSTMPAAGVVRSASHLSMPAETTMLSGWTQSPGFTFQRYRVASTTLSPRGGTRSSSTGAASSRDATGRNAGASSSGEACASSPRIRSLAAEPRASSSRTGMRPASVSPGITWPWVHCGYTRAGNGLTTRTTASLLRQRSSTTGNPASTISPGSTSHWPMCTGARSEGARSAVRALSAGISRCPGKRFRSCSFISAQSPSFCRWSSS
jgi:hypothetical protein